jgi:hypothetical protein
MPERRPCRAGLVPCRQLLLQFVLADGQPAAVAERRDPCLSVGASCFVARHAGDTLKIGADIGREGAAARLGSLLPELGPGGVLPGGHHLHACAARIALRLLSAILPTAYGDNDLIAETVGIDPFSDAFAGATMLRHNVLLLCVWRGRWVYGRRGAKISAKDSAALVRRRRLGQAKRQARALCILHKPLAAWAPEKAEQSVRHRNDHPPSAVSPADVTSAFT